jgi:mannosyl-oligosaccharide glucosidase
VYKPQHPFAAKNHELFGQEMISNLLGGMGYFHGTGYVDLTNNPLYDEQTPDFYNVVPEIRKNVKPQQTKLSELFTCVPSRPFFPRGFLWDEGFHLLTVIDWDVDLAIEVLQSWLSLMDDNGWIAREQILGDEARSKVPEEYWIQFPQFANPPMLFWVAQAFVSKASGKIPYQGAKSRYLKDPEKARKLLDELYPKLKMYYSWFKRTQSGHVGDPELQSYRWRGRTKDQTLCSGLDDYPRASPPSPAELHVDATGWVGSMDRALKDIAQYLGRSDEVRVFAEHEKMIQKSLDTIHWSDTERNYCDTTVDAAGKRVHSCHNGYTSLLPFISGVLGPDHPHLNDTLAFIRDPSHIWSEYGLRSMSKADSLYGGGENYWRGPIWINFNYLSLARLLASFSQDSR